MVTPASSIPPRSAIEMPQREIVRALTEATSVRIRSHCRWLYSLDDIDNAQDPPQHSKLFFHRQATRRGILHRLDEALADLREFLRPRKLADFLEGADQQMTQEQYGEGALLTVKIGEIYKNPLFRLVDHVRILFCIGLLLLARAAMAPGIIRSPS